MNKEQREAINSTIEEMESILNNFNDHDGLDIDYTINPNDFSERQVDLIVTFVNSFKE